MPGSHRSPGGPWSMAAHRPENPRESRFRALRSRSALRVGRGASGCRDRSGRRARVVPLEPAGARQMYVYRSSSGGADRIPGSFKTSRPARGGSLTARWARRRSRSRTPPARAAASPAPCFPGVWRSRILREFGGAEPREARSSMIAQMSKRTLIAPLRPQLRAALDRAAVVRVRRARLRSVRRWSSPAPAARRVAALATIAGAEPEARRRRDRRRTRPRVVLREMARVREVWAVRISDSPSSFGRLARRCVRRLHPPT